MNCIYCLNPIVKTTKEHIIQSSLGSSIKSTKIICQDCNNYFSRKDSGNIDKELVGQFNVLLNLLNVWGDRNNPPPTLKNVGEIGNHKINLGPGGTPIFAGSIRKEPYIDQITGNLIIEVKSPDIKKAKEQLEHIKKQYKTGGVKLSNSREYRKYCNDWLKFQMTFGGNNALKAVIKNLYNFIFYIQRDREIDLGLKIEDFDNLRNLIRYNKKNNKVYSSIDYKNYPNIKIEKQDLSNFLFVYGSSSQKLIFGFFIVLGHINFSAVLKEDYLGSDFGFMIKQNPLEFKLKEFDSNVSIPRFNSSITKNYPEHAKDYFPIVSKKMNELIEIYFDNSSKATIENIVDISLNQVLSENISKVTEILAEEIAKFIFRVPSEQFLDNNVFD